MRRRDDLHAVAAFQFRAQWHQFMIDLGGYAAVADVRVHRVGKIHAGSAVRQRHDLALGGEHVDLVRKQVHLEVLEKLDRVAAFRLHLQQALEPLVGLHVQFVDLCVVLVQPVGSHARLRDLVHFERADLHLYRRTKGAEKRSVQRLVAVALGDGDVVLELAGNRLVQLVQRAQCKIAGGGVLDDYAETVDVKHLREGKVLLQHLLVNAVQVFLATADGGFDVTAGELLFDGVENFVHHLAAISPGT